MEPDEMRGSIEKWAKTKGVKFHELGHVVARFCGYVTTEENESREVVNEVLDHGQESSGGKFTIIARDADGRFATGNPSNDLDDAISTVHWRQLFDEPVDGVTAPWSF